VTQDALNRRAKLTFDFKKRWIAAQQWDTIRLNRKAFVPA
jgi:hypothetical protein